MKNFKNCELPQKLAHGLLVDLVRSRGILMGSKVLETYKLVHYDKGT